MDKEQAIKLAQEYKKVLLKKMPVKALYLYGLYSKSSYTEESDIDIAVVVEHLNDDYFADTPLLWKLKRRISNLIEPVLLRRRLLSRLKSNFSLDAARRVSTPCTPLGGMACSARRAEALLSRCSVAEK